MSDKELPQIPNEEGAYSSLNIGAKRKSICLIHKENWTNTEYVDNKDGTISCPKCGWGARLPGYMKIVEGKIVDLRGVNR
jgi:hypothetical protein